MKKLFLIVLMFGGVSSFASPQIRANEWLRNALNLNQTRTISGQTPDGTPCALYISDKGADLYTIVVGLKHEIEKEHMDDYIGLSNKNLKQIDSNLLGFDSVESWGNTSKRNAVKIELNAIQLPVRAVGVSDLKTIDCKLN